MLIDKLIFVALIIKTVQHKLIDIQESPLVLTDQSHNSTNPLSVPLTSRRHSLQGNIDGANFFEQQFAHHIQCTENQIDWNGLLLCQMNGRRFHANALNWLKLFNVMRDKCEYDTTIQRRFKTILRKTSSENELLLMSPSNESNSSEPPTIRRSFSSGILF